jgi:Ca2+-binding RTX toxin-like protein
MSSVYSPAPDGNIVMRDDTGTTGTGAGVASTLSWDADGNVTFYAYATQSHGSVGDMIYNVYYLGPDDNARISANMSFGSPTSLTNNDDTRTFGDENNFISGLGGNDTIDVGNGANIAVGNTGADTLIGGNGTDIFLGDGASGDQSGNDTLTGNDGNDDLYGGNANDTLSGGNGNDLLAGGRGDDLLRGDSGNDFIVDLFGNNTVYGGTGQDYVVVGGGNNRVSLGADDDIAFGGDGNDSMHGNAGDDTLTSGGGTDHLYGDAGSDLLIDSGAGKAYMAGGGGADTFAFLSIAAAGQAGRITDFGTGDVINVSNVLQGYDAGTSNIDRFVRLVTRSADRTDIKVNADGLGGDWLTLAAVSGTDLTSVTATDLVNSGRLILNQLVNA